MSIEDDASTQLEKDNPKFEGIASSGLSPK